MSDERPGPEPVWKPSSLKRWLQEPLLHFLLAGLGLFVIYGALRDRSPTDTLQHKQQFANPPRQFSIGGPP